MIDDLILIVGGSSAPKGSNGVKVTAGNQLYGWTSFRVTRGIERCPSDFEIALTEKYPGQAAAYVAQPGDQCQAFIGDDLVITGAIDRFIPSINKGAHSIILIGRSKCADLVDCSAEWPGGQISGASALGIAQKLAEPYNIFVRGAVDTGPVIPQTILMRGESAFEIIERTCRYRALLAFDDVDGNLILSGVGTTMAASGVAEGINIESASVVYSIDQRFSDYVAILQAVDAFRDSGEAGYFIATVQDPGVKRHRLKYIIAEAAYGGIDVSKKRILWEMARRYGRSTALHVRVDSWRDSAGILWTPNTLIPVSIPSLKVTNVQWLIGEVSYLRDEDGTHADLVIMPPAAFQPAPIAPPAFADVPVGVGRP